MSKQPPIVKLKDERPAGKGSGECFYCSSKIGERHGAECPLWTKTVTVKATITYDIEVPHHWDKQFIEFQRNESSWCASNMIQELEALEENGCLCPYVDFEYLNEGV